MFGREPALWLGALQAIVALAVGFGLDLSVEQTAGIVAVAAAVLAVVTRQQVTPLRGGNPAAVTPRAKRTEAK